MTCAFQDLADDFLVGGIVLGGEDLEAGDVAAAGLVRPDLDLGSLSELIKKTAYKVTRVGELIGREVAESLGIPFGVVDLSLAPTPNVGDSVGEIFQSLGLLAIGVPGTTAALALLNDAVKKGGAFASSRVGGMSGAFIPVIAPVGVGPAGERFNINADLVAGSLAGALKAEKLILLTDQKGILDKDKNLIPSLNKKKVENMVKAGTVSGGMLPKTKSCFDALEAGCSKVHIIDGRVPHALLLEIFTKEGIGTEITL